MSNQLPDEWKIVRKIEWLEEEFNMSFPGVTSAIDKDLKKFTLLNGFELRKVPADEYPEPLNCYHVDTIAAYRAELKRAPMRLCAFRQGSMPPWGD